MAKVPVNGSVTPEKQNGLDFASVRRHAKLPLHGFVKLECLEVLVRTTQPENGRSAHLRG